MNRKVDWTAARPMTEADKKAANQQQYAYTVLLIMTMINIMFGVLMVSRILPVWLGMILAFSAMTIVFAKAKNRLLDSDESLFETADDFHNRRKKS
jgi:hypothetical protein